MVFVHHTTDYHLTLSLFNCNPDNIDKQNSLVKENSGKDLKTLPFTKRIDINLSQDLAVATLYF